jgi:hypothetical protein
MLGAAVLAAASWVDPGVTLSVVSRLAGIGSLLIVDRREYRRKILD